MSRIRSKKTGKAKPTTWKKRFFVFFFGVVFFFLITTAIPVFLFITINPPTTPLMWIRWAQNDYSQDNILILKHWKPLQDISPHLIRAVIAAEDQNFFNHRGIDWSSVWVAFRHNLESGKKIGASTITMQTARNVFLWQDRTWLRKSLEVYFTLLIEWFWTKNRILEVYLNVIEWGEGIFGCEAAAHSYFHRHSGSLSLLEAAQITSILPNPRAWSVEQPAPNVVDRQNRILKEMKRVRIPLLS